MTYLFYQGTKPWPHYAKTLADESILEANETYLIKELFGVNNRPIQYYLRRNTGLSKIIDGENPRMFIYLGESVQKFFVQLEAINKCYTRSSLINQLLPFEYILTVLTLGFCEEVKKSEAYRRYDTTDEGTVYYSESTGCLRLNTGGRDMSRVIDDINTSHNVSNLLYFADHLLYEISHFKLDFGKLEKSQAYKDYENANVSPKLKRTMTVGGVILFKAAVKMVGAEIDLKGDFDIPDIDGDFDSGDFDIPDIDGDFDNGYFGSGDCEYDSGEIDNDWDYPTNNANIDGLAFQGKKFSGFIDKNKIISVHSMGGGPSFALHVYVKNGTNSICVSDGYCEPVPLIGHNWITVGSHNFDIADIKRKL